MRPLLLVAGFVFVLAGCMDDNPASPMAADQESVATLAEVQSATLGKKVQNGAATYEVTIVNKAHSQPFSPGVIVTHDASASLFEVGTSASEGVRLIAENGDPTTALAELGGTAGVSSVVNTAAPVHRKGGPGPDQLSIEISASAEARYLSLAVMLICTNDGFVGLDSVELPRGAETKVYLPGAYDAGTEANDELATSIVDACGAIGPVSMDPDGQNDRTATTDAVGEHDGIGDGGDLSAKAHNWRNKVAQVKIRRVG